MNTLLAYTDGSAVSRGKNAGKGGFGVYIPDYNGEEFEAALGFRNTKTGRMEVMALLVAIKAAVKAPLLEKGPLLLHVYSDSEYVVKSFTEKRLEKWIANGWMNTSGVVKNRDLWEKIHNLLQNTKRLSFKIQHIRSHQVEKEKDENKKRLLLQDPHIKGNMRADALADYKRHEMLIEKDY